MLSALEAAERTDDPEEKRRLLTFVVVGGGPTGVELAGAIADLSREILHQDFRRVKPSETRVVLVEMADRILMPFEPKLSESARLQLGELGVDVRVGVRVESIDRDGVLVGGEVIRCRTVLWAAGVRPNPLAASLGAARDRAGRIVVEPDCTVPNHREVFVIGDMAALIPAGASAPLPGISPVAIQEGHAAARNILRAKAGMPPEPFRYFDKGFMATIGKARAVAQLGRLRMTGFARLALLGRRSPLVPGRLPQPPGGFRELDLGLRHLEPQRAHHLGAVVASGGSRLMLASGQIEGEGPIVFLTGAGISAESGIPTFRGAEGYWRVGARNYQPMEMATAVAFARMPAEVWRWYLFRRGVCRAAAPNVAHLALVGLEQRLGDRFLLVTQNVDGLHLRAGSSPERTFQIHGNIDFCRCIRGCSPTIRAMPPALPVDWTKERSLTDAELTALRCDCGDWLRPHVLWFDESYDEPRYRYVSALRAAETAAALIVVGTSGATTLPARMCEMVAARGVPFIVVDPEPTVFSALAAESPRGQMQRRRRDDGRQRFEAGGAGLQRDQRLGAKARERRVRGGDIRRIREDQIEALARHGLEPATLTPGNARHIELPGILGCDFKCLR